MSGEFELIDKFTANWKDREGVVIGTGDDASAILSPGEDHLLLQSTDLLVENIHFRKNWGTFFQLGWKALAVNLSDIAAMGGTPRHSHLSLAVPPHWSEEDLLELMHGYKHLADLYSVSLLGGDLSRSEKDLMIAVHVTGTVHRDQVIRRSGAQVGDVIWVAGLLGDAPLGLRLLQSEPQEPIMRAHIHAFLQPEPQVELGQFCARSGCVHAMIDMSDGLAGDLGHILRSSRVGAVIREDKLPFNAPVLGAAEELKMDLTELALRGGEEYLLIGCTPADMFDEFAQKAREEVSRYIIRIGQITEGHELILETRDGQRKSISPTAHDHFKSP